MDTPSSMDNTPNCEFTEECNNPAQFTGYIRKDGSRQHRKTDGKYICAACHFSRLNIQGWEYKNNRKDYCENAKGRYKNWLPVTCSVTKMFKKFLHIDHLDGDHGNNDPDNLMTLCPTCHAVKTWIYDS
jgi:hypothetical protein